MWASRNSRTQLKEAHMTLFRDVFFKCENKNELAYVDDVTYFNWSKF